jgi:hypothetical protein
MVLFTRQMKLREKYLGPVMKGAKPTRLKTICQSSIIHYYLFFPLPFAPHFELKFTTWIRKLKNRHPKQKHSRCF